MPHACTAFVNLNDLARPWRERETIFIVGASPSPLYIKVCFPYRRTGARPEYVACAPYTVILNSGLDVLTWDLY